MGFGYLQDGLAKPLVVRDVVGWWRSRYGGTIDFQLECESEARRPAFSPPATHLVSDFIIKRYSNGEDAL